MVTGGRREGTPEGPAGHREMEHCSPLAPLHHPHGPRSSKFHYPEALRGVSDGKGRIIFLACFLGAQRWSRTPAHSLAFASPLLSKSFKIKEAALESKAVWKE